MHNFGEKRKNRPRKNYGPIMHNFGEKRKNRARKNYGPIMHNFGKKRKNRPRKITARRYLKSFQKYDPYLKLNGSIWPLDFRSFL